MVRFRLSSSPFLCFLLGLGFKGDRRSWASTASSMMVDWWSKLRNHPHFWGVMLVERWGYLLFFTSTGSGFAWLILTSCVSFEGFGRNCKADGQQGNMDQLCNLGFLAATSVSHVTGTTITSYY
ncbi:hypothetical protein F4810DRAFT_647211 [Camillea tinctor]|nr:hypothetical protein F4810DRAFT_647211 [Camillea tinctor]